MDDLWQCATTTEPTARRRHVCNACHGYISPGEAYSKTTGIFDGEPSTFKACHVCKPNEDREHYRPAELGEVMTGRPFWTSDQVVTWYSPDGEQWECRDLSRSTYFSHAWGGCFEELVRARAGQAVAVMPPPANYATLRQWRDHASRASTRAAQRKAAELTRGAEFVVVSVVNDSQKRGTRSTIDLAVPASSVVPVVNASVEDGRRTARIDWRIFDQQSRRIPAERLEY